MDEQPDRVSRILAGSAANLAPAIVPRFWVGELRIRRCGVVSLRNPRDGGEGSTRVLIDGFRYVEFEWVVIKRGEGKGGREKRKGEKMCAFLAKFPSSK